MLTLNCSQRYLRMAEDRFPYEQSEWHSAESERWLEALERQGPENVRATLSGAYRDVGSRASISVGSVPSMTKGFAQEWLAWHDRRETKLEDWPLPFTPEEIVEQRIRAWKAAPRESVRLPKVLKLPRPASLFGSVGRAHFERPSTLDLSSCGLTTVPEALRGLKGLSMLDLSKNHIKVLPRWVGELTELIGVNLGENKLQKLPSEIRELSKLG